MENEIPDLLSELEFRTSRSGGKGGQNVNKVETRVELLFNPSLSRILTEEQKEKINARLIKRLSADGYLRIVASEDRSQLKNREIAIEKFYSLLEKAFHEQKKRKRTKPSKAAMEARLNSKRLNAQKKENRRVTGF